MKTITAKKQEVIDLVIESLKNSFELGDYTVLEELLTFIPTKNLVGALTDEEQAELKKQRVVIEHFYDSGAKGEYAVYDESGSCIEDNFNNYHEALEYVKDNGYKTVDYFNL